MVEGYFVDLVERRKDKEFWFDLYLKDGKKINTLEDHNYKFKFWASCDPYTVKTTLEKTGINLDKIKLSSTKLNHGGTEKYLAEIELENPYQRAEVVKRLKGIKNVQLIGAKRSIKLDYLIQSDFAPLDYLVENNGKIQVLSKPELNLSSLAWDIETYNFDKIRKKRFIPKPENGAPTQMVCISFAFRDCDGKLVDYGVLTHTYDSDLKFVKSYAHELGMIKGFNRLVNYHDPDIFITQNGDGYDFPYLGMRTEKAGLTLKLGRDGSGPKIIKSGMGWIYHFNGRINFDLFPILPKASKVPSRRLKDAARAILHKEPVEIEGTDVYKYWDSDELRPKLFEYSLGDAIVTDAISQKLGICKFIPKSSKYFKLFPEQINRKTGDEICAHFVYSKNKKNNVIDDKKFDTRDYVNIKEKFVRDAHTPGKHNAAFLNLDKIHPYILARNLKHELKKSGRGLIVEAADELLKAQIHIKRQFEKTNEPCYETLYKFSKHVSKELPSLVLSRKYEWHDKNLSKIYEQKLNENIDEFGKDKILYAGWDKLFILPEDLERILAASKSFYGRVVELEFPKDLVVPVIISDKDTYLYLNPENNLVYTNSFSLERKSRSEIVNKTTINFAKSALTKDKKTAEKFLIAVGKAISAGKIPKSKMLHRGMLSKPKNHYIKNSDDAKAAELYGAEPHEQFEYGKVYDGDEKIVKTKENYNPKPSDIINEILDRIEPIGKGLGLSRNNMKDMLKEGYRQYMLFEV